jgi:cobalt/nickel transport system permease protein
LVALGLVQVLTWLRAPAAVALFLSCALAHLSVYTVDAGMLGLALAGEKPFLHWFTTVVLGLSPVQVPLALLEGALSVAIVRALARRRPDLVPAGVPVPASLAPAAPLALFVLSCLVPLSAGAEAERWRGADEAVLEAVAEKAGRPAQGPVLELPGELTLFTFSAGTFLAGLWVGNTWARLTSRWEDTHGR